MEQRGRPFERGNKFGRGRPRGSRNKSTLVFELLEQYKDPLLRKSVVLALEGNVQMLRALIHPMMKGYRGSTPNIGRLPTQTLDDVSKASVAVINHAASGNISLDDAQQFSALLENRRRVIETEELDRRLRELESKA